MIPSNKKELYKELFYHFKQTIKYSRYKMLRTWLIIYIMAVIAGSTKYDTLELGVITIFITLILYAVAIAIYLKQIYNQYKK